MKSLRILRTLSSLSPKTHFNPTFLFQFFSAQSQLDHPTTSISSSDNEASTFDSSHFTLPPETQQLGPTLDERYRAKSKSRMFGEEVPTKGELKVEEKEEDEERRRALARALLEAALEAPDQEDEEKEELMVKVEDQKSLSVGIIGAPNACKSALTNYKVGTKVASVSQKTNTTTHEALGVMTKGDTQIAVKRPWDEDPFSMSEEVMKNISLEVVRERLLDHVHQKISYELELRLVDWKDMKDGSLRIEQHLITHEDRQRKKLVGKGGSKIGRIGMEANEQLRSIFKRNVHLILQATNRGEEAAVFWSPPSINELKSNVDDSSNGEQGDAGA